ncbi:MAG: hypothetical protein ACTJHL_13500 [Neisseriaceae bacterium]
MSDKYLTDDPKPEFDAIITKYLDEEEPHRNEYTYGYPIAIRNNGKIYRSFNLISLRDVVGFTEFIYDYGLRDIVGDAGQMNGYVSIFEKIK